MHTDKSFRTRLHLAPWPLGAGGPGHLGCANRDPLDIIRVYPCASVVHSFFSCVVLTEECWLSFVGDQVLFSPSSPLSVAISLFFFAFESL